MGVIYDSLMRGLEKVEMDTHIILDRTQKKVQEISLKRYVFFSNSLEASNIKLSQTGNRVTKEDKEGYKDAKLKLKGEKALSQLRKLNAVFKDWQTSNKEDLSDNLKSLKKEEKKI